MTLRIKPVKRYTVAKYPRVHYWRRKKTATELLAKGGFSTFLLLALQEACEGGGISGPPPVPPDMVTENEARQVIKQVFDEHGVGLQEDVQVLFNLLDGTPVGFVADGYNDSLRVGYEYMNPDWEQEYIPEPYRVALESGDNVEGAFVKFTESMEKSSDYAVILRSQIETFIETLKANGII